MARTTDWIQSLMWAPAAAAAILLTGCGDGGEAAATGVDAESSTTVETQSDTEDQTPENSAPTAGGENPFDLDNGSTPNGDDSGGVATSGGDNPFDDGSGGSTAIRSRSLTAPNTNASNPFDDGGGGGQAQANSGNVSNPFDNGGSGGQTRARSGGGNPFDTPNPPVVNRNNNINNNTQGNTTHTTAKRPTVFREHKITDPGMNNQVAARLLVPEDWKIEGGMTRISPQYFNIPFLVNLTVTAPDGRRASFLPSFSFGFSNERPGQTFAPTADGNMTMPLPESPGKWIMEMSRLQPDPTVSNLRVVSEEMIPDLTQQLRQQSAPMYQMIEDNRQQQAQMQQWGGGGFSFDMGFDTQATKVVLRYTQDGKELEETVLMTWGAFVTAINQQVSGGSWYIGQMRSVRGPVGMDYMNDPELMAIFKSVRNDPRWEAEMHKHYQAMARIRNKGAQDRMAQSQAAHRKRMQTLNETSDIISNGWKKRQAIRDAGHARQIDAIHEVTPYTTPDGGTVKLPSYYDNVYTDGGGRFILSNDAFYNPNGDLNLSGSWQEVQQRR